MATSRFGTSRPRLPVLVFSILVTTSMPSTTLPNTTCLPSRKGVGTVVMKNCEPFVFGPAFCLLFRARARVTSVTVHVHAVAQFSYTDARGGVCGVGM